MTKEELERIKQAVEWRNNLNFEIDDDTFYNIAIPCMEFGYNKCNEEMQKNGLALQSDMDKTIEQNMALKKACDETQELLDKQIEATYKVVEENTELKAKYDSLLREDTGLKIHNAYVEKKLAEAKYIIKELLDFDIFPDVGIKRQAEQFLSEVK